MRHRLASESGLNLIELQIVTAILVGGVTLYVLCRLFPVLQRPVGIGVSVLIGLLLAKVAVQIAIESLEARRVSRAVMLLEKNDPAGDALVETITGASEKYRWLIQGHLQQLEPLLERAPNRIVALRLLLGAAELRHVQSDRALLALAPEIPEDLMARSLSAVKDVDTRFAFTEALLPRATKAETRREILAELFSKWHVATSWPPNTPPASWLALFARYEDDFRNIPRLESLHGELYARYSEALSARI